MPMDYKAFFWDVYTWTMQANQEVLKLGIDSPAFWTWVADSAGALCQKYNDRRLVIKQMMMLVEWLEEAYETRRKL